MTQLPRSLKNKLFKKQADQDSSRFKAKRPMPLIRSGKLSLNEGEDRTSYGHELQDREFYANFSRSSIM